MTEQQSSVDQPSRQVPGRFTTSMAVLKEPVSFPSELKEPQKSRLPMPLKLLLALVVLGAVVFGTLAVLPH